MMLVLSIIMVAKILFSFQPDSDGTQVYMCSSGSFDAECEGIDRCTVHTVHVYTACLLYILCFVCSSW